MEQQKLQHVREALAQEALIAGEVNSGITYNGRKGTEVERLHIFVSPMQPTEQGFDDFRMELLTHEDDKVSDWNRSGGVLYAHEVEGQKAVVLAIQLYPDVATAVSELEALRHRLEN